MDVWISSHCIRSSGCRLHLSTRTMSCCRHGNHWARRDCSAGFNKRAISRGALAIRWAPAPAVASTCAPWVCRGFMKSARAWAGAPQWQDLLASTTLLAGLGLVAVSTLVGLLYKVSQATSGGFQYSTVSAIAIAEMIKLAMSVGCHVADAAHCDSGSSRILSAWRSLVAQVSIRAVAHIWVLAALYSANNQLSFFVYTMADPGTVYLFKAASTMIVALIQCTFVGKTFTLEQWKAMLLQGVGMIIVQYNPCQSASRYPPLAYVLMSFSAVLSAACSVRNEYLVKNFKVSLNVQNTILYAGGACMNIFAFFFIPNPNNKQANLGFFEGYNNYLAVGVVFVNALIGLAITAVYKYADAITKCIAGDITAVILCIISSSFFELEPSITMWCGVVVVCFAVHLYTAAAQPQARAVMPSVSAQERSAEAENGDASPSREFTNGHSSRDLEMAALVGKRCAT